MPATVNGSSIDYPCLLSTNTVASSIDLGKSSNICVGVKEKFKMRYSLFFAELFESVQKFRLNEKQ